MSSGPAVASCQCATSNAERVSTKVPLHYTDCGTVRLVLDEGGFRVEDSGVGIPLAEQERMFQPFVRGAEGRGEGLGLGLSLVKRICAHQGWQVGVVPRQPQGSCFQVRLHDSAV